MNSLLECLARLRPADLLRSVAFDAELRGLPRPFVDAIRAGVDALDAELRREMPGLYETYAGYDASAVRETLRKKGGFKREKTGCAFIVGCPWTVARYGPVLDSSGPPATAGEPCPL